MRVSLQTITGPGLLGPNRTSFHRCAMHPWDQADQTNRPKEAVGKCGHRGVTHEGAEHAKTEGTQFADERMSLGLSPSLRWIGIH